MSGAIVATGTAVPEPIPQQEIWDGLFAPHLGRSRHAGRLWRHAGVEARGGVVDPRHEDARAWGTEARMERFVSEAVPLGAEAIDRCLGRAGLDASEIDQFTVVSCTGYATPGVDALLADKMGMASSTQRLHVGHMGCYAALPALGAVADTVTARAKTALLLCVELCSLHVQPPTDDLAQVVAHALFADAAAAVAVRPGAPGWEVVDVVAHTDTAHADAMTWDVTDTGFRMGLSPRVPTLLAAHVGPAVDALVGSNGLRTGDIAGWVVHPGGPRILDVVGDRLGLADDDLAASRAVLASHGNCSSPTVLLILERLLAERSFAPGDHVVMLAFGPGLTLYGMLLRCR